MLNPATTLELETTPINRRQVHNNQDTDWDQLTLSQQFSVSSLCQFGYMLTSIRFINNMPLAILKLAGKVATINAEGMINIKPDIVT